jgi:DNA-directed RNA polymerase specialized sigma24 family protein
MELLEKATALDNVASRQSFFEGLYEKAFPPFARFAARMHASLDDTKDIFHDALIIYCEKCQKPGFAVRTTAEAYVVGIAKNLWLRKFNRDRHLVSAGIETEYLVPPDYFPSTREVSVLTFLERTGKRCLDLLVKFYFEKSSLKEISGLQGYSSEHSAAVQKHKCIGKVRDAIREKLMTYEDFLD